MRTSPNLFKSKQKQIPFKSVVWCSWCKEGGKGRLRRVCWSEIPARKRLSQRVCDFKTSMASLNKSTAQQLELLSSIQRPFDVHFLLMSRGLGLGSVKARQHQLEVPVSHFPRQSSMHAFSSFKTVKCSEPRCPAAKPCSSCRTCDSAIDNNGWLKCTLRG